MGLIFNNICPCERYPLGRLREKRRHMKTEAGAGTRQATASELLEPLESGGTKEGPSIRAFAATVAHLIS